MHRSKAATAPNQAELEALVARMEQQETRNCALIDRQ